MPGGTRVTHDDEPVFHLHRGEAPLLISIPHVGTRLPREVRAQLTATADILQDTDWHLDRLYGFAAELGASVLQARLSRYAIDLNRPPTDESLYPGQTTTTLCPTETFHGTPLYPHGRGIDAAERERRLRAYWQPYHAALRAELDRLSAAHGTVLLWDAHSIASRVPRLFDGRLPDFNFGTADGRACAPSLVDAIVATARAFPFSQVLNGRFKGGYITRHYGAPVHGIQAVQLEMCQCLYMDESAPFDYLPAAAAHVQEALRAMLTAALVHLPRLS
jgi:N-formylglutamate deformylase